MRTAALVGVPIPAVFEGLVCISTQHSWQSSAHVWFRHQTQEADLQYLLTVRANSLHLFCWKSPQSDTGSRWISITRIQEGHEKNHRSASQREMSQCCCWWFNKWSLSLIISVRTSEIKVNLNRKYVLIAVARLHDVFLLQSSLGISTLAHFVTSCIVHSSLSWVFDAFQNPLMRPMTQAVLHWQFLFILFYSYFVGSAISGTFPGMPFPAKEGNNSLRMASALLTTCFSHATNQYLQCQLIFIVWP